ncbi:hypothetical protein [Anaeromassilibacillus sp. An200]|uniref:hypothetical protein n=1 Tax=Anaeromassilibacillus sp. An200 TaxID=1965587 RepID=UPI000B3A531F|nr:hypothetical protein [Anaeromassilibacillus sp. An200]OUP03006.1 hypothetical protein B5F35_18045 [Anaeromassilibacillus sp. An200]OUP11942.1 hypothetical protein B5F35_09250 [Anaeromassilibacillus sp. An200]
MPVEIVERIVPLLVSLIAAATPIVLAIFSNGKKSREQQEKAAEKQQEAFASLQSAINSVDKRLETVEAHAEADYKNILQIQIMSEEMPLEVRLEAGEKYVARGWNGAIKAKYELLKDEYRRREMEGT